MFKAKCNICGREWNCYGDKLRYYGGCNGNINDMCYFTKVRDNNGCYCLECTIEEGKYKVFIIDDKLSFNESERYCPNFRNCYPDNLRKDIIPFLVAVLL